MAFKDHLKTRKRLYALEETTTYYKPYKKHYYENDDISFYDWFGGCESEEQFWEHE